MVKDVSEEVHEYHLVELIKLLVNLQTKIDSINRILSILVLASFVMGVITPLLLLIGNNSSNVFGVFVIAITSLNVGCLSFFLMKFPFLIKKEYEEVDQIL